MLLKSEDRQPMSSDMFHHRQCGQHPLAALRSKFCCRQPTDLNSLPTTLHWRDVELGMFKRLLNNLSIWNCRKNVKLLTTTNLFSHGLVVETTDLHPASMGSTPAGTHVSRWWEGHLAKIAPMCR